MRPTIILVALLLAPPLSAQGWIEPVEHRPVHGIVKLRTSVSVHVTGRIAQVEVEEWFENRGGNLGEGDYLYPLPGEAVFSSFSLFQGDRELRGETLDAETARRIYEEIVRRKKDPALIELVGHGLIRSRVFPINPGERRKIKLRYTQVLEQAGDAYVLRYAGGTSTPASGRPSRPTRPAERPSLTFRVRIDDAERFRDPLSPTHDVEVDRRGGQLIIRPVSELSGDFSLLLPLAEDVVGISVVTHKPDGEDGYFMLTLAPGLARGGALPRDITAVVDVSGSMSGGKLEQAQAALQQLLGSLHARDRFRLVAFSSRVRSYGRDWSPVTRTSVRDAEQWIMSLIAEGGTNIEQALNTAFEVAPREGAVPIILFLTDGLPSVGEQDPERIAQQAERSRGDRRVFAFGIGYDVNTYLLDRLSDAGRGATQYVAPDADVEEAVSHLVRKVQRPILRDLALAAVPVDVEEIYPVALPDLFAEDELVVFGRYRARRDTRGAVTLSGRRGGRTEEFASTITFPSQAQAHAYIPRLWAARKLGFLTREVRLHGANDELIEEIRQTALQYGLLSEYTSYFVQEPMVMADGQPGEARLPMSPSTQDAPAASGAGAVMAAERARVRREVRSKAEMDAVDEELNDAFGSTPGRRVAGRLFVERDGRWVDGRHAAAASIVEVEIFSDAYFRLLERLPELEPYARALDKVVVAGERVSIALTPSGESRLSPGALRRIVRDFRGL